MSDKMSQYGDNSEVMSEAELATAAFDKPYRATQDTEWNSNPASMNPQTGPIAKGDVVLLIRDPDPSLPPTFTPAKYGDRRCHVRPAHFKKGCD